RQHQHGEPVSSGRTCRTREAQSDIRPQPRGETMKTVTSARSSGAAAAVAGAAMMSAVVQDGYGPAGVLRLAQVAVPGIADDEVLLRVRAAGLDRGTWHLMTGQPYLLRLVAGLRKPRNAVMGLDVAGTVVAAGPEVTRV